MTVTTSTTIHKTHCSISLLMESTCATTDITVLMLSTYGRFPPKRSRIYPYINIAAAVTPYTIMLFFKGSLTFITSPFCSSICFFQTNHPTKFIGK